MEPLSWLTSLFGPAAPDVMAGAGMMPPVQPAAGVSFAGAGAPQVSPDFPPAAPAPQSGTVWDPVDSPGVTQQGPNPLAAALRGVAAPQVPAAQRVSTPAAPRLDAIKGGELLTLLMMQGDGGVPGGRKINPLPGTLGQALNMPRY